MSVGVPTKNLNLKSFTLWSSTVLQWGYVSLFTTMECHVPGEGDVSYTDRALPDPSDEKLHYCFIRLVGDFSIVTQGAEFRVLGNMCC